MTKGITTVYIEKELVEQAKELNINISNLLNTVLFEQLRKASEDEVENTLEKFQRAKVMAQEGIERINDIKREILEKQQAEKKLLIDIYGNITEVKDLNLLNLKDVDFMTSLVDMLRVKYNNRYISMAGIKDYMELRK
jgi:post-segregation antitoxin (ccd killing protein)